MDEVNLSNDFYSGMFSFDFDRVFSTANLESFSHFVIGTIYLVIGLRVEQFMGNCARNFKSLARLLPELYFSPIAITYNYAGNDKL